MHKLYPTLTDCICKLPSFFLKKKSVYMFDNVFLNILSDLPFFNFFCDKIFFSILLFSTVKGIASSSTYCSRVGSKHRPFYSCTAGGARGVLCRCWPWKGKTAPSKKLFRKQNEHLCCIISVQVQEIRP